MRREGESDAIADQAGEGGGVRVGEVHMGDDETGKRRGRLRLGELETAPLGIHKVTFQRMALVSLLDFHGHMLARGGNARAPSQRIDHHEDDPVKLGLGRLVILADGIVRGQAGEQRLVREETRGKDENGDGDQEVGDKQQHGAQEAGAGGAILAATTTRCHGRHVGDGGDRGNKASDREN